MAEPTDELLAMLAADGLVDAASTVLTPLSGGVSGDVMKVTCPGRTMVVKRALGKLRVQDDWFADPARIRYEHRYMSLVGEFLPDAVPMVIHANDEMGYFCMEWLGEGWDNWKEQMLRGHADAAVAARVGRVLGRIHRETFAKPALRSRFDNIRNFDELRLEPYLLTTGRRHPRWEHEFISEAERIRRTRESLVHGDYSPKNIMVRGGRIVVLDCEVAWFGDPSFDLAFLLNHLHLKALYHAPEDRGLGTLSRAASKAYHGERGLSTIVQAAFGRRVARLLLMLMLARVDGKSPVEYLANDQSKQDFVRRFVLQRLPNRGLALDEVSGQWFQEIRSTEFPRADDDEDPIR